MNQKIEEKFDGLTKEEWFEEVQEWPVSFLYYYKYYFEFINSFLHQEDTDYFIKVCIGGSSDDIYRCEIFPGEIKIKDLPLYPEWILIKNMDTQKYIEVRKSND